MLKKITLLITLFFSFNLAACDDGGEKSAPKLALADVESEYYNLFCEQIETCGVNPYFDLVINDRQGCLDFLETQLGNEAGLADMIAAVNEGTIVYDAEKGYACIEAMKALACDEFGDLEPEACNGTFTGTIDDNGECFLNEECVSGYCNTETACPGTCEPAVATGDACDSSDQCITGAKCILGECAVFSAPVTAGNPCDSNEDWCATGLYCNPDTNVCAARIAQDQDCDNVSDQECVSGTMCFGIGDAQKTCTELTIVETADAACDYNAGIMCAAYNDLTCAIDDFQALTGTCQTFKQLNEVCFDSTNLVMTGCDMFGDLYCDMSGGYQADGTCKAKLAGGDACTDSEACLSGFCDVDVCADEEDVCR
ncbi:hypothetical protein KKD52_06040, partial [Myxococcota bacterium]|nr:hypothetical protein [Myxococcota bacterium]MBU1413019.1 hypothetical protein [Myxococcota bacterium]MBU1509903.1 hypothetical protein [Myxococcota bacterium]